MTVEEIFTTLAAHMEKGIRMHEDLVNVFDFLGLKEYKKEQKHHFEEEVGNKQKLCHYYMRRYHKLLQFNAIDRVEVIPISWYKYTQFDVDINSKRNAIKTMFETWIKWEKETKALITKLCVDLFEINDLAAMEELKKYLCDVDEELADAEKEYLDLAATGFDIIYILSR